MAAYHESHHSRLTTHSNTGVYVRTHIHIRAQDIWIALAFLCTHMIGSEKKWNRKSRRALALSPAPPVLTVDQDVHTDAFGYDFTVPALPPPHSFNFWTWGFKGGRDFILSFRLCLFCTLTVWYSRTHTYTIHSSTIHKTWHGKCWLDTSCITQQVHHDITSPLSILTLAQQIIAQVSVTGHRM
jgi:hypothetical protein